MPLSRFYRLYGGIFAIERFKAGEDSTPEGKVKRQLARLLKGPSYGT